ncbi:Penicillin-binding protein 1B, isoform gamma [Candidatus Erwinia haradaeae]|uniref:Penicillin-binding protein 1B n=1 Tax=Candidatus Erwinia haradaeae TaxID=1922217 RepID=A0A451CZC3_9GAMM|nr:Penicillin-binding protein 1B, isoform gamma [Candidatus Erwinia haradaeae]
MKNTKVMLNIHKKNRWIKLIINSFCIILIVITIYGYWLDSQIRTRIDGKVWQLPASVYGRVITLQPHSFYTKKEVIQFLKVAHYRQVKNIISSGEFSIKDENIEIIRRTFNFPDKKEMQIHAILTFKNNYLDEIKNFKNGRNFGFLRLDPRLITLLQSPNGEQRLFVERKGFPNFLVNTLLTTEDRGFYQHCGINIRSIGRALFMNLMAGHAVQGGSTLTQQLVKNLFLTNQRSLWRKINEAYMAIILEARYKKDRILELYLNEVYLGQAGNDQLRGFPIASLYYFGRPVNELSLDQQTLLVGMVKGASLYNPWRHPQLTLKRRNFLLHLLAQKNIIKSDSYELFSSRPLGILPKGGVITPQPAFMQMVRNEIHANIGDKIQDLSGLQIFTTLDPVSQNAAEKSVAKEIALLRKKQGIQDLETAMIVVDRFSGEVRAMVGGADPRFAGYNRVLQARRSIGSLAKPAIYLTALCHPNLYGLNTWISDNPLSLKQKNGKIWQPKNDSGYFSDRIMLIDALTNSLNVPAVTLGMQLGLTSIIDTWARLGAPNNQLQPIPSILLGALNLTPIEVAQTFQTIASGGNRAQLSSLRSVMSADGDILYQSFPQLKQTVPIEAAYLTLYAIQQVVNRGTAVSLGVQFPHAQLAGKTGTTNNLVDSWFAGIDGKTVTITWIGRDNNQPTRLYGENGAMRLYQRYLEYHEPMPLKLQLPHNIQLMNVNFSGTWICNDKTVWRILPMWTEEERPLCQKTKENKTKQTMNHQKITNWFKNIWKQVINISK